MPCYLVVHPKGTLMWDVGVIPDSQVNGTAQGISTVTKTLKSQMAEVGYSAADIEYLALSHLHSDHTANANDFAGSTWLVHQNERDAMFAHHRRQVAGVDAAARWRPPGARLWIEHDLATFNLLKTSPAFYE